MAKNSFSAEVTFKRQPHKMVRHTQLFVGNLPTNGLSVFDHFALLALKGITIKTPD